MEFEIMTLSTRNFEMFLYFLNLKITLKNNDKIKVISDNKQL